MPPKNGLWFSTSVDYARHPKVIAAGADGAILNIAAIGYARQFLTDGFIPASAVCGLTPMVKRSKSAVNRLVLSGLWMQVDGGYLIHDYAEWNPTKADIQAKREGWKTEKNQQRGREEGDLSATDKAPDKAPDKIPDTPPDKVADSHAGAYARTLNSVSTSTNVGVMEGGVGETNPIAPAWRQRGPRPATLVQPIGNHAKCYHAPVACARGLCVPAFLGRQWDNQSASQPVGYVAGVIAAVVDATPQGPVGDDLLPWWRAQWRAKHGSAVGTNQRPSADDIRAKNEAAFERVMAKMNGGAA